MWEALLNPSNWGVVFALVLLEGLLSADNALVIAVMVQHLPEREQKKALLYGLWGAFVFRLIAIIVSMYLVKILWFKILGAGYLLWLVFNHFFGRKNGEHATSGNMRGFWATVIAVDLLDLAFSVDSILAAVGISNQLWVLFAGGCIGILAMRFVATIFISLIKKMPELEHTAYVIIALIGVKMLAGTFGLEIEDVPFLLTLAAIFGGSMLLHFMRKRPDTASQHP
jgi:YkoY family integral membrane protein